MGCNVSRLDGNAGPTYQARLRPLFLQRLDDFKARRHGHPLKAADSTPSKKQLLSHDIEDINNASHHSNICNNNPSKIIVAYSLVKKPDQKITREVIKQEVVAGKDIEIPTINCNNDREEKIAKGKGKNEVKEKSGEKINIEDDDFLSADEDIEDGEEEDDDDDERMIGYVDDDAFPGSPSFRVYFEDQRGGSRNDIGKKDAFKEAVSSDDNSVPSSKESSTTTSSSSSSSSLEKKVKRGRKKRSFRRVVLPKNLLNMKSCYTCAHPSHRPKTSI